MELKQQIVEALRSVLGDGIYPLHEPRFFGNEQQYVRDCIASTFVSSVGAYVERFERDLAGFTGARRAVAVVNGTAALHVALRLAGVLPEDEVIMPALTFVATANAVHYVGATPHFADSSEDTLGIDPVALRDWLKHSAEVTGWGARNRKTGRQIRALLPMHTFGHPCDLDGLLSVAFDYKLAVVEDAAESLGSYYHGRHVGTFGLLGALSFNGNKIITTGGGGAILTNDDHLADYAKHLTTTAKVANRWEFVHDEIGYNFRMPNINAALGCAQLEQVQEFLDSKRRLTMRYLDAMATVPMARLVQEPIGSVSNYWLQTLLLDKSMCEHRDEILLATNEAGFMTRPSWRLMHRLVPYQDCPRAPLSTAESIVERAINLPSSAGLV